MTCRIPRSRLACRVVSRFAPPRTRESVCNRAGLVTISYSRIHAYLLLCVCVCYWQNRHGERARVPASLSAVVRILDGRRVVAGRRYGRHTIYANRRSENENGGGSSRGKQTIEITRRGKKTRGAVQAERLAGAWCNFSVFYIWAFGIKSEDLTQPRWGVGYSVPNCGRVHGGEEIPRVQTPSVLRKNMLDIAILRVIVFYIISLNWKIEI